MNSETQTTEKKMVKNMIDITNVTDNTLDVYLQVKANPDGYVTVDHLTTTERRQLAELLGWDINKIPSDWLHKEKGGNKESSNGQTDYEGLILEQQEDETWGE